MTHQPESPVRPTETHGLDIAIVAVSCRLSGGLHTPEAFARHLYNGGDVFRAHPRSLMARDGATDPDKPRVGLLQDPFGFDPQFFGMSPREAQCLDPQHRVTLTLAAELFERAGLAARHLSGAPVGVFIGVGDTSYAQKIAGVLDPRDMMFMPTGNALNAVAGRVSHAFRLRGPAIAVDTACSSSLVALDLAVQAVRDGRCEMAVAGGVNIFLDEARNALLTEIGMLSPDGQCRVFDAAANGYVRAEGAVMLLVKPLEQAQEQGDTILGVICGTGCSHNGGGAGLSVPNPQAQIHCMRMALENAGCPPTRIGLVEAHGTGTRLGDPIEVSALAQVFANTSAGAHVLRVTSSKAQFGHCESAAGLVGVLKALTVFHTGLVPPQFGLTRINPALQGLMSDLSIPTKTSKLAPAADRILVNSFGFSGTNASVVLAPPPAAVPSAHRPARSGDLSGLLCLSGHTAQALNGNRALAGAALRATEHAMHDVTRSMNAGRSHFGHRRGFVGESPETLIHALALAPGQGAGRADAIWLCPGQGTHFPGMMSRMRATLPGYRRQLTKTARAMSDALDMPDPESLLALLDMPGTAVDDDTQLAQAVLFVTSYAMGRLLMELGCTPTILAGQSAGEITACALAGVWSLETACRIVARRGALMRDLAPRGGMLSLRCSAAQAQDLLAETGLACTIAGLNEPRQTVVAGASRDIDMLAEQLTARRMVFARLPVATAFHSPAMRDAADAFGAFMSGISAQPPSLPILSTMTGKLESEALTSPRYWSDQMTRPVDLLAASAVLASRTDPFCLIEVGANRVLGNHMLRNLPQGDATPAHAFWDAPQVTPHQIERGFATLYEIGSDLDFDALTGPVNAEICRQLPTMTRATDPCLPEGLENGADAAGAALRVLRLPGGKGVLAEHVMSLRSHGYLRDHVVFGQLVAPGAMHCVYALDTASALAGRDDTVGLANVQFTEIATRTEAEAAPLQLFVQTEGARHIWQSLSLGAEGSDGDIVHATGELCVGAPEADDGDLIRACRAKLDAPGAEVHRLSGQEFYDRFRRLAQLDLGPSFRWVEEVKVSGHYAWARFRRDPKAQGSPFRTNPGLLDAVFQVIGSAPLFALDKERTFVPFSAERITRNNRVAPSNTFELYVEILASPDGHERSVSGNAVLRSETGEALFSVQGFMVRAIEAQRLLRQGGDSALDPVLEYALRPVGPLIACGDTCWDGLVLPDLHPEDIRAAQDDHERIEACALDLTLAIAAQDVAVATGAIASVALAQRLGERLDAWRSAGHAAPDADLSAALQRTSAVVARYPHLAPELDLLMTCAAATPDVLAGQSTGVQVLFPDGDGSRVRRLYAESAAAQKINAYLAQTVANLVAAFGQPLRSGPVRILEIGGGTGGSTAYILEALPEGTFSYTFTDLSAGFVTAATARFGAALSEARPLDIEGDIAVQGFDPMGYDIVIAANVLHATRDLPGALAQVHRLLADNGALVMLEGQGQQAWLDLTFGLTDGWWHFTDSRRDTRSALCSAAEWDKMLAGAGLGLVPSGHADLAQAVHVARKLPRISALSRPVVVITGQTDKRADVLSAALTGAGRIVRRADGRLRTLSDDTGQPVHLVHLVDEALPLSLADYDAWEGQMLGVLEDIQALKARLTGEDAGTLCQVSVVAPTGTAGLEHVWSAALKTLSFEAQSAVATLVLTDEMEPLARYLNDAPRGPVDHIVNGTVSSRQLQALVVQPLEDGLSDAGKAGHHVLIGGYSDLAGPVARWLAKQGATDLHLLGRNTGTRPLPDWAPELLAGGLRLHPAEADLSVATEVCHAVEAIQSDGRPIVSLFHLGGRLDNRLIEDQGAESWQYVARPKVRALLAAIAALQQPDALECLCVYSSAAAVMGSPGQINHTMTNAALDGIVATLRARWPFAHSIAWGPWDEIGAAARSDMAETMRAWGLRPFARASGEALAERLLSGRYGSTAIALDIDWRRFAQATGQALVNREAARLATTAIEGSTSRAVILPDRDTLLALPGQERSRALTRVLIDFLAAALNLDPDSLRPGDHIHQLGLDSLIAIELRSRLKEAYGADIATRHFMEDHSIQRLAMLIDEALSETQGVQDASGVILEGEL